MSGKVLMAEKRIEPGRIMGSLYLEINLSLNYIPEERKQLHPFQGPRQPNETTPFKRGYRPHYDAGRTVHEAQAKATVEVSSVIANVTTRQV